MAARAAALDLECFACAGSDLGGGFWVAGCACVCAAANPGDSAKTLAAVKVSTLVNNVVEIIRYFPQLSPSIHPA